MRRINEAYFTEGRVTDGGMTQKSWILPNGDIKSFGSEFHYSFLLNNPSISKKHKIDMSSGKENPIRISAIKNGLFRVNYEVRSSNVVFEGLMSRLNKNIKDGIIEFVGTLRKPINNITIRLFNDDVTKILVDKTSFVGTYDNVERVDHIPMVTEGINEHD